MGQKFGGFTLFELLIAMTLIAVLLAVALPSFSAFTARQRQHVEINALFHAVHSARKESIMRRKVVSICPSRDGTRCGSRPDWSAGWLVFENRDRDSPPQVDDDEPLLRVHRVDEQITVQANRNAFTLRATVLRATNGSLVVCDPKNRVRPRALVISYTGRPRVAEARADGKPYRCAY